MKHKIKSTLFEISINEIGAEICSFKSKKTGQEYIWQADPKVWGSSAPVLFPIIGALKEGKYQYEGNWYELPKHGLIRYNKNLLVEEHKRDRIRFVLSSDNNTREIYPFDFQFRIQFSISDSVLTVSHQIINLDNQPMYFSLGAHPAFCCPLIEGEEYEDYELHFENSEFAEILIPDVKNGLITNKTELLLDNSNIIQLSKNTFNNDALIFKNLKSNSISLNHKSKGQILSVDISEFPYLGIWAKPGADFVCIEPWIGIADSVDHNQQLKDKTGCVKLDPNQIFSASYSIEVFE